MKYYDENANKYIEETINCDMSEQYQFFLKHMKSTGKILDIGFGSGRDMIYFASLGYEVEGIDPTEAFVEHMKSKGYSVETKSAQDLNVSNKYDGIWACASLLHIPRNELNNVFKRCSNALKEKGIMYCSFKKGDFEGVIGDRFFSYLTEELIIELIKDSELKIVEIDTTGDKLSNRDIQWLNVILQK